MAKNKKDQLMIDEVNENEKRRMNAITGYEKQILGIRDLQKMTDTASWDTFYSEMQLTLNKHGQDVLIAESTRDIIRHQEGVKIIREVLDFFRKPIDDLNKFINSYPLFAGEMKIRAEWNTALGKVEIREI